MKTAISIVSAVLTCIVVRSPAAAPRATDPDEMAKIKAALPEKATVAPAKARKLLIFDSNVNYGGHPSAAYANEAFKLMGEKTGAFTAVISRDPSVFERDSLKQFDAIFFNNNVGNLFTDARLRANIVDFVYSGGGMLGVHGSTVAFTVWPGAKEDWPEFGLMIGGRGANHRNSDEHVFAKFDEADHPLVRCFGGSLDYRDEFFRVHDPYSRNRVRVLMSIDMAKLDPTGGPPRGAVVRDDNDYAIAWVRNYGRGRTFYCTIAHNPRVFYDPLMIKFYLGAIQFALGDLPAPTTPSARLTAAARAQEKHGWRVVVSATGKDTLFEAIEKAGAAGALFVGASDTQEVSGAVAKAFKPGLSDDDRQQIRFKLDAAGVRLTSYDVANLPTGEDALRALFDFARRMGIETIVCRPNPAALEGIKKLCHEYDLKLAIRPVENPGRVIVLEGDGAVRTARQHGLAALHGILKTYAIEPAADRAELVGEVARLLKSFSEVSLQKAN